MNPLPLLSAWLIALVCGLVPVILAAVVNSPQLHMVAAGGVALVFALIALREANALRTAPSPGSAIASSTARFSGLVWAWGALGIFITYVFILPGRWHEWWHFVLGFGLAAFLSIAFSILLDRDRAV
jgi:hypothetical protein